MPHTPVGKIHEIIRAELEGAITGQKYSLAHIEQAATPGELEYFTRRMIAGHEVERFITHLIGRLGTEVPTVSEVDTQ